MLYTLLAIAIAAITYWLYGRGLYFYLFGDLKTPGFLFLLRNRNQEMLLHKWVEDNKPATKDFYKLWLFDQVAVVAASPDAAKFLLTDRDHVEKAFGKRGPVKAQELFGHNIVSAEGADWRRQKSLYSGAFGQDSYKIYFPIFTEVTKKCMKKFADDAEKGDVDVVQWLSKFTLDVLGLSIFEIDFQSMDGKISEYYEAYRGFLKEGFQAKFLIAPWLTSLPFGPATKYNQCHAKLIELLSSIIEQKRNHKGGKTDILAHLIQASESADQGLTQQELISNVFVLFLAGHDTTSSALSWLVYELSRNQDIQERLYQQIISVAGERDPTYEEVHKMPYLDMVISESMRMHPPVTLIISRKATEEIHYNGVTIPKDHIVGFDINHIHHSPDIWENPESFDPERFSAERKKGMHRFAYLPFSLGPRQCIGNTFSLIEQHIFTIKLLQTFKVLPPQKESAEATRVSFINTPEKAWVTLQPRK